MARLKASRTVDLKESRKEDQMVRSKASSMEHLKGGWKGDQTGR